MSFEKFAFLGGGGEMGALMRATDWAATPFGPLETWPEVLRSSVAVMLHNLFPTTVLWGPDLRLLYNDAYLRVLGAKHPQSFGQACRECWAEVWDVAGPLLMRPLMGGAASLLSDFLLEMNRKGFIEETYFAASYSPIPNGNAIGGVLATCYETTDKVLNERRFQTLANLSANLVKEDEFRGVFTSAAQLIAPSLDIPFALLYAAEPNATTARLVAAAGIRNRGGKGAPENISLDEPSSFGWPLAGAHRAGKPIVVDDVVRRFGLPPEANWSVPARSALILPIGPPGSPEHYGFLIAGISPRLALDDGYRSFLELLTDEILTALRKARLYEEERRKSEALARADRAKDQFLAMLGHELRNPLAPIRTALHVLKTDGNEQRSQWARSIVERQTEHLIRLVDDLLDVSRINQGKITLRRHVVPLDQIVREAIDAVLPMYEAKRQRLSLMTAPEPLWVDGDTTRLVQVFANLLNNACKFTPLDGLISVVIAAKDEVAQVVVKDTGAGIGADDLGRIFDLFVQGEQASGGLGVGLAVARLLIEMHGGKIDASSAGLGRGSEFTVTLPLTAPLALSKNDGAKPDQPLAGRRILIVDDNVDAAETLSMVLTLEGAMIDIAHSGEDTLPKVRAFRPEMVLLDIGMPDIDGYEVARRVHQAFSTSAPLIVALTGYGHEAARERSVAAGLDGHLVKPIEPEATVKFIADKLNGMYIVE